jgi:hypothetical protein
MAVFSAYAYWSSERVEGRPGTIIEGMLVSRATFNQINQDTGFLRDHLTASGSVLYLADDGDLSVLDGRYRSTDPYFVDWGGSPPLETRLGNGTPIVVQKSLFGAKTVSDLARSTGYKVIASNPRLVVLMPVNNRTR